MALYLSLRAGAIGGNVKDPEPLEGTYEGLEWPQLRPISARDLATRCSGRDVLFGVHGFNVSFAQGARSLGRLSDALPLNAATEIFIGILWPGDFWIPAVNYPFAGGPAIDGGRRLAAFCNRELSAARSFSFASHSLGARLVLEATAHLARKARGVCMTAGAVNRDCLTREYATVPTNAQGTATLSSRWDLVLKLAYPAGDAIANLFQGDHAFFKSALGRDGPPRPFPDTVEPSQIPDDNQPCYDHGDYFPPTDQDLPPAKIAWQKVEDYLLRTFRNPHERWT